jgi:hypothetical protein
MAEQKPPLLAALEIPKDKLDIDGGILLLVSEYERFH